MHTQCKMINGCNFLPSPRVVKRNSRETTNGHSNGVAATRVLNRARLRDFYLFIFVGIRSFFPISPHE